MSIQEIIGNIKRFLGNPDSFVALVLIGVSIASFALGRASVYDGPLSFSDRNDAPHTGESPGIPPGESTEPDTPTSAPLTIPSQEQSAAAAGAYVASKNGTKYHLPWCVGAQQIKEENKVWFATKEDAEKAGYAPAGNCKGL